MTYHGPVPNIWGDAATQQLGIFLLDSTSDLLLCGLKS